MKKLKMILPMAFLFVAPWTHWILYNNLLLAFPGTSVETAHGIVGVASTVALIVTLGMAGVL